MQYISIRNWTEYQHYKDRSAPWIKLHKEIITGHSWVMGNDASRLLSICIMLLALRTDNKIPYDLDYIKRFSNLDAMPDLKPLVDSQFIDIIDENGCYQDASTMLSDCPPEKRENRIEENRIEERKKRIKAHDIFPEIQDRNLINDWTILRKSKKAAITQTAINGIEREAKLAGISLESALRISCENGWAGFKSEWVKNKQKSSVQEARLDVVRQIMGDSNGNSRQIIDVTPQRAIESDRASIPKIADGIWESDAG